MFLYTLGIEELLVKMSKNVKIVGYLIPASIPRSIKSTGYADDIGGTLRTLESIAIFFQEFKDWGKISGASVNEDKTKILALNILHKDFNQIKFVEKIKILGIIFNKNGVVKENLETCVNKIKNALNMWNSVGLNMLEKIAVLRTFAINKLWYKANFYVSSETDIKCIES